MSKPLVSFAILILSAVFAFFYVVPEYELSQTRRGDIDTLTKILGTSNEIRILIDKTKKNLSSIEPATLARFEVFLPEYIDPIRFANNIQYIGRKNRIVLSDIKVEEPGAGARNSSAPARANMTQGFADGVSLGAKMDQEQGAGIPNPAVQSESRPQEKKYVATKATFSFPATYETFQLFLDDLEKSLGLIDVTSLSFTSLSDDKSTARPTTVPSGSKSQMSSLPTYQFTMAIETYSLR